MKKGKWIWIAVVICLLISTAQVNAQPEKKEMPKPDQAAQRQIKHVILITVDGLNSKGMSLAYTPNLNGLAAQGINTQAINVLPANFPTFAASLLTGADPNIHGYNETGQQIKTEVLPEIILKYGRSAAYVSVKGGMPKGLLKRKGDLTVKNYEAVNGSAAELIQKAIEVFESSRPYFLGIRLSVKAGPGSSNQDISKAVSEVDGQIGRLFNTLMSYGVFNESLILTVGNYSTPRGGSSLPQAKDALMVPVIMAGPGLKSGVSLPPIKIVDVAPTVALLCNLQISPESNGLTLWNALESGTRFGEENLLGKRIKELSEANIDSTKTIYDLQEEKRLVKIEKENITAEKLKIRQKIDGKDQLIKNLSIKIALLKTTGIITVLVFLAGYVIEYFILRKRFLMF